jgi:formylglycine-generating enzyme required for sulfatase activity
MVWQSGQSLRDNAYRIGDELGRGGFGITYLAEDVELKCPVVIKSPHTHLCQDPSYGDYLNRFKQEGQRLANLKEYPNVVRVSALFSEQDIPCLVMNFVEGETLFQKVQREGATPEKIVVTWILAIAEALDKIHGEKLVHRDANPANIMIQPNGHPVLIDFGIALEIQPCRTTTIAGLGGHYDFAPYEQLARKSGSRDPKVDIYCLAATLYFAITGQIPSGAYDRKDAMSERRNCLVSPRKLKPGISKQIECAILSGMQFYPEDRPATMRQWIEIIQGRRRPVLFTRRKMIRSGAMAAIGLGSAVAFEPVVRAIRGPAPTATGPLFLPGSTPPVLSSLSLKDQSFKSVILDSKGKLLDEPEGNNKYLEEDLGNGVKLRMTMIPGGTFNMGSPDQELLRSDDEGPVRTVKVPDFFMGQFVITQEQWEVVAKGRQIRRPLKPSPSLFGGNANHPVERVNWLEAFEFCDRLTQLTKRPYRLPSEAEWEYACRARTRTPFHTGATITTKYANYQGTDDDQGQNGRFPGNYGDGPKGEYVGKTVEVNRFPPNAFGLHQMHGNVWEWCLDTQHSDYKDAPADGKAWLDPNSDENSDRSLRGGSWFSSPRRCRSAFRNFLAPGSRYDGLGFRVVFSLRPQASS